MTIELHLRDGRKIGLVHAEVRPGERWSAARLAEFGTGDATDETDSVAASLIWGRNRFADVETRLEKNLPFDADKDPTSLFVVPGIELVIAGHSINLEFQPLRVGNCLWIDTGAFLRDDGGVLMLVDPAASVYWQVGYLEDDTCGPLPLPEPRP